MVSIDLTPIKEIYPFEPKHLEINGHRLSYVDEGKGNPIVMLHGNPTWSFYYRRLISELKTTHRVIAPDHLGCGLSDKPQDYDYRLEAHIDNVEELLHSLDLRDITLVLHDWGGAIGMGFAVRYPQRIKSLIILNSAAYSINYIPLRIALCRVPVLGQQLVRGANLFCRGAIHMAVERKLEDKVAQGLLLPYDSWANRVGVMRFIEDIPMGPEHRSYEGLLEIEHGLWLFRENPVALIWGMKDWCFNPRFLKRWRTYYPQADVLEIPHAGHYVMEDGYELIIPFIREFLRKNGI